jgi:hypothetical protein
MQRWLIMLAVVSLCTASNYVINGDFEQALTTGWTQTTYGSGAYIGRSTTYHPDADYEVYVYKPDGSGYARLYQVVDIPTVNLDFSVSAKLYAWDNNSGSWVGAGVIVGYLDESNALLGVTRICYKDAQCPWYSTSSSHNIQIYDSLWHDYSFNIASELANLPAVDPEQVDKILVAFVDTVYDC